MKKKNNLEDEQIYVWNLINSRDYNKLLWKTQPTTKWQQQKIQNKKII